MVRHSCERCAQVLEEVPLSIDSCGVPEVHGGLRVEDRKGAVGSVGSMRIGGLDDAQVFPEAFDQGGEVPPEIVEGSVPDRVVGQADHVEVDSACGDLIEPAAVEVCRPAEVEVEDDAGIR